MQYVECWLTVSLITMYRIFRFWRLEISINCERAKHSSALASELLSVIYKMNVEIRCI
jgi:hypothetical protein